jgi:hypothetical protein
LQRNRYFVGSATRAMLSGMNTASAIAGGSIKTVRNHITRIFAKLEVENRAQAIVMAREPGFGSRTT